jgi:hypothetical protein
MSPSTFHLRFKGVPALSRWPSNRAGRNAEAVNWEERSASDTGSGDIDAAAFAVLAMAQHRLGRREQASAALDKAEAIVAKKMADPGSGRPFGRDWDDWSYAASASNWVKIGNASA